MRIFIQYEKYKIPRDTYSNISHRQLTCKLIRTKKEEGFNRLWWILYTILEPALKSKCLDIYTKNKFHEPGTELADTLHGYLLGVMEVVLRMDKPFLSYLEFDTDAERFSRSIGAILRNINLKNITKSINFAEKTRENIEISSLEEGGKNREVSRIRSGMSHNPDFAETIHRDQVYKTMHGIINAIRNNNQRIAMQLLLENKSYEEISNIMGIRLNLLYTHIHHAKNHLRWHLKEESLLA